MTKKNKILLISSNQHFIDIFLLDFFRQISKKNEIILFQNLKVKILEKTR